MTDVIITAPHALCVKDAPVRMCDLRASEAAHLIEAHLERALPPSSYRVMLSIADRLRSEVDLNRAVGERTAWRRNVQALVQRGIDAGRRVVLLDIHSFPNDPRSFGVDERSATPHVVLLEFEDRRLDLPPIVRVLASAATNDITVQARRAGADTFLWEFNEDDRYAPLTDIAAIAEFMRRYLERARSDGARAVALTARPFTIGCHVGTHTLATLAQFPVYVESIPVGGGVTMADRVFAVRDDLICGGTKTRALPALLELPRYAAAERFGYVSSTYGTAHIALAWTAARLTTRDGRRKVAVIEERHPEHPNARIAASLGAQLVDRLPRDVVVLPSGFREEAMVERLAHFVRAVRAEFGQFDEVWSVIASGTLAQALQRGALGIEYHVVNVYPGSGVDAGAARVHEYDAPVEAKAPFGERPPFQSNVNYDAKTWRYVLAAHQRAPNKRILFWNVAA